jgi:hypothetical protein
LQNSTNSFSKSMQGKYDVQYRFETPNASSNLATAAVTATAVASMSDQSMPMAQVNYGYKQSPVAKKPQTLTKRQHTARLVANCQHTFSELMHDIGNVATVRQSREIDSAVAPSERYASELPSDICAILDRQMPLTEFGMRWEPGFQVFYGSGKIFANHEATDTVLTHDLAHLLIGACGNLPWCPKGDTEEVVLAEYNAVFIENILDKVYNYSVDGTYNRDKVLFETLTYVRWFVDVHYASFPFPIPAEEAYRRFCRNIDVAAIVRLSPLFFAMKHIERTFPEHRNQTWELHFNTADAPPPDQVAVMGPDGLLD